MNRTLARAIGSVLIFIVSFTTAPVLAAQEATAPAQAAPASRESGAQGQNSAQTAAQQTSPTSHQPPVELPENPGRSTTEPSNAPAAQSEKPEPNGTAVAPQVETSGGAASKPAGVAIAPPKQRRVRSLLIKLGILAGAGVAIGTVAGLSAASPSHVPNSPGH
jgi:FtsZ-interacting cell division protein ZipA